jgi:hypothetical protein
MQGLEVVTRLCLQRFKRILKRIIILWTVNIFSLKFNKNLLNPLSRNIQSNIKKNFSHRHLTSFSDFFSFSSIFSLKITKVISSPSKFSLSSIRIEMNPKKSFINPFFCFRKMHLRVSLRTWNKIKTKNCVDHSTNHITSMVV